MIQRIDGVLRRKFVKDTLILQVGKFGVLGMGLLSSVVVPVLMGPQAYGVWQLALSFYAIWQFLDLTGIIPSAQTRLALAVGAKDERALLESLGFFIRTALLYCAASTALLALTLPLLSRWFYAESTTILYLALWLTLTQPTEMIYQLLIITFSSRRQMRHVALLQNMNQLVLVASSITAVLWMPTPQALVISRWVYSGITLLATAIVYERTRLNPQMNYPSLWQIARALFRRHSQSRDYWRFGFINALDKNIANLYTQLPVQLTGALAGEAAAGYIGLALNVIRQQTFFTSALMDNMQAIVPQSVGRGDYARLWRNFRRVVLVLAVGSGVFYALFALVSPWVVPLLYGQDWLPVIPLLQVFALFGAVTTVGSVFGPLYRAFDFVRGAFFIKLGALVVLLPLGYVLVGAVGAVGGAWLVNLLFVGTVALTAWLTLPELRTRAHEQMRRAEL